MTILLLIYILPVLVLHGFLRRQPDPVDDLLNLYLGAFVFPLIVLATSSTAAQALGMGPTILCKPAAAVSLVPYFYALWQAARRVAQAKRGAL